MKRVTLREDRAPYIVRDLEKAQVHGRLPQGRKLSLSTLEAV